MSYRTVANLIKKSPEGLGDDEEVSTHLKVSEKVLAAHIESHKYALTTAQRSKLRDRLIEVAVVVYRRMQTAANMGGAAYRISESTDLYGKIAAELQMSKDQLTSRVMRHY